MLQSWREGADQHWWEQQLVSTFLAVKYMALSEVLDEGLLIWNAEKSNTTIDWLKGLFLVRSFNLCKFFLPNRQSNFVFLMAP